MSPKVRIFIPERKTERTTFMRILENRYNWYKGNLHMHTTVSDGVLEPADAMNRQRRQKGMVLAVCGGKRQMN